MKNYQYDTIGNITLKDGKAYTYAEGGAGPHAVTRTVGGGVTTTYTYDANGNMATKQVGSEITFFDYDVENRLIEVKKGASQATAKKVENYLYDGDGGRTRKISYNNGVYESSMNFVGSLFETTSGNRTGYIFLGGTRIASITNGEVMWYLHDHLGGTNVLTDADGAVKQIIEYEPYGKESRNQLFGLSPELAARYAFTNHFKDEKTGLIFMQARYYDPSLGRFITADTIVPNHLNPQEFNRYSYVLNNPINRIDPSGNFSFKSFFKKVVGAVVGAVVGIASGNPFLGFSAYNAFTAVAEGGNIGAALGGAVAGYFGGGAIGNAFGSFWGTIGAGALGGATGAAIGGGNVGLAALSGLGGSLTGYGVGAITGYVGLGTIVGGGVGSKIAGGRFSDGAIGGLAYNIGYTIGSSFDYSLPLGKDVQLEAGDQVFFAGDRLGKSDGPLGWVFSAGMAVLDPGPFNHTGIAKGGDIIMDSHPDSTGSTYNGPGERNIRKFGQFPDERVLVLKNKASLATAAKTVMTQKQQANVQFGGIPFTGQGDGCYCSQFTAESHQANGSKIYGTGPNSQSWYGR